MTATRNKRRQLTGVVTSTKADKTITVEVVRTFRHPKYGKYVRRSTKYAVHDEKSVARVGDTVIVTSTRPLSKRKRWRLVEVTRQTSLAEDDARPLEDLPEVAEGGEA